MNVKFRIVDSHEIHVYRNCSQRTLNLKLFECAPRKTSYLSTAPVGLVAGPFVAADALQDPASYWVKCLADENAVGVNISNALVTSLGLEPSMSPAFNKQFKVGLTKVVLEPGATFELKVQGPNNFEFDSSSCFEAQMFASIQKYSRYIMPVSISSLSVSTNPADVNAFCRMPDSFGDSNRNEAIGFERKLYCKIEMPEMAGFKTPGAAFAINTNVSLGNRKHAYIFNNWNSTIVPAGPFAEILKTTGAIATFT